MLGGGAGEDAADLADKGTLGQSPPVWSQKLRIWAAIVAEAGGRAHDDRIIVGKLAGLGHGRFWSSLAPAFSATSRGIRSATALTVTSRPRLAGTLGPAFAIVSIWPYML
jgi:hypothetical protein